MAPDRILVPIDFTPASEKAVQYAAAIAERAGWRLALLHVQQSGENELESRDRLADYAALAEAKGVPCDVLTEKGNVVPALIRATEDPKAGLMVMATHGVRGARQNLFGADALKIGQQARVPVLIVQAASGEPDFRRIVFPFGGHERFSNKTTVTHWLAEQFGSKVDVYCVDRPGSAPTERTKNNAAEALRIFADAGVAHAEIHEEPTLMSAGFALQTIQYAERESAGLIVTMASKTAELGHISGMDKEALINNKSGIPVLLVGDVAVPREG